MFSPLSRDNMVAALRTARTASAECGHDVSRTDIGWHNDEVLMADDSGAYAYYIGRRGFERRGHPTRATEDIALRVYCRYRPD